MPAEYEEPRRCGSRNARRVVEEATTTDEKLNLLLLQMQTQQQQMDAIRTRLDAMDARSS